MKPDRAGGAPITVVIPTRNRPGMALHAATAILRSRDADFRLLIVDQTDDGSTIDALRAVALDPRVTVVATASRGAAAARNFGVAGCDTPLIAFTDDDCEPAPEWLAALVACFAADPTIGVIFGTVEATTYDRTAGFIPAYRVARARTAGSIEHKAAMEGIGANMAIRRTTWEALGGFDEALGTGAPLRAGEETDLVIRALIAGCRVHETPAAVVTHYGFRAWSEADRVIEGYMTGLGAANAKMLRLGGARALRPLAALAWRWLAQAPVVDLNHRPSRRLRLAAFLRGARAGLACPIDRRNGRFGLPGTATGTAPGAIKGAGACLPDEICSAHDAASEKVPAGTVPHPN